MTAFTFRVEFLEFTVWFCFVLFFTGKRNFVLLQFLLLYSPPRLCQWIFSTSIVFVLQQQKTRQQIPAVHVWNKYYKSFTCSSRRSRGSLETFWALQSWSWRTLRATNAWRTWRAREAGVSFDTGETRTTRRTRKTWVSLRTFTGYRRQRSDSEERGHNKNINIEPSAATHLASPEVL